MLYAAKQDPAQIYRRRWITLLVLCISLIVIIVDNTILNIAIPTLAKPKSEGGLGASASQLQWIVDTYTIGFAGLLLIAGALGDRFGRYKALSLGLIIFGFGSVGSAFATSAGMLIGTRGIMGLGAAFIMPSTLSVLTNTFTDSKERAQAIGVWAGVSALGIGIGPITGGALLAHFWWGSVFLVNIPVVLIGLVLGYFFVPESSDPSSRKLDPVGAVLSIVGITALLYGIIEAPTKGWTSPIIIGAFVAGALVVGAFLLWESRSDHPMLDIVFFKNARFSVGSGAIMLTFFALFGTVFLLTQYLQVVLGYSTVKAGAILIPLALMFMVFAPLSAVLDRILGSKIVIAAGLFISGVGLALFTTFGVKTSTIHVILVTMVLAAGMANVMAPATESIMGSLPPSRAGVGSAVNDTTREFGGALGVAILGSILASIYSHKIHSALGGLPKPILDNVSNNVGQAVGFANVAPPARPIRGEIIDAAKHSFVSGFHVVAIAGALVLLLAVVVVVAWLPSRSAEEDEVQGLDDAELAAAVAPHPHAPTTHGGRRPADVESTEPVF